jgi:hypothetical protein
VEGEASQPAERRVAGPEVVDRQLDAQGVQVLEDGPGVASLVDGHALGHLQLEAAGRQPGAMQCLHHPFDHAGPLEGPARDVHRHPERGQSGVGPVPGLLARRPQDPVVERDDQARLLGHGHEVVGGDHPVDGVRPSDQRLDSHDPARGQIDLGLVHDAQLTGVDGVVEVALQGQLVFGGRVHVHGVGLVAVPPAVLGPVHGGVGVLQQGGGPHPVVGPDGDADAGRDEQLLAVEDEGMPEGDQDLLRHHGRFPGGADVGQQHGELVPAHAGHRVRAPHHRR